MRLTRAALVTLAGLFVVVIVAALALWRVRDLSRYSGTIESALSARLHRPVSLGRVRVDLPHLALQVDDVRIADDPEFKSTASFAQIDELSINVKPMPLLFGRVELRSVELRRPTFELVRRADGTWNVGTLSLTTSGKPGTSFSVDRVLVSQATLATTDRSLHSDTVADRQERVEYRDVNVELHDLGGGRFDLTADAAAPDAAGSRLKVRGTVGPLDAGGTMPFDGSIECRRVPLAALRQVAGASTFAGTDALLSGSAAVQRAGPRLSSKGTMQLEETRARGVALGYPAALDFNVAHDATTGMLTIEPSTLRLNQTAIDIAGAVDMNPTPAVLTLHVRVPDGPLTEAARLSSAFGLAFGAGTHVVGRVTADLNATGPLDALLVEGGLQLRQVSVSGPDIPKPVRADAIDLALTRTEIRARDFTLVTNGTSLGVRFSIRNYAAEPAIDASIRSGRAGIGELLSIAHAWGFHAVDDISGAGFATVDLRAVGPKRKLRYSGTAALSEATLKLVPLTQPLHLRTANITFAGDSAKVEKLHASVGEMTVDGQLTVRDFDAPNVTFQLAADKADVVALQQLTASTAPASPRRAPARGESDSLLRRTTGSGRLSVGALSNGSLTLNDVNTTAALERGVIRLDPLDARLFGGRCRGSVVVDTTREPTAVAIRARLEQVDSNQLASAMFDMPDVIQGALASDVRVAFATGSTAELTRSLNGTFSLNIPTGRIAGMDLLREVTTIARFAAGERDTAATTVTSMKGSFTATNGIAATNDLTASIESGRIAAKGTVNLVSKALNMRVTAVLSRDFSRSVGGTKVGGYMTTVLANQQGELVVPMTLTGTFQHPNFAPDVAAVADMRLRNLVPTLTNPQTLGSAILDALGRKRGGEAGEEPPGPFEQPAPEQPEDTQQSKPPVVGQPGAKELRDRLQQALEELLGGRKPEQKPQQK